MSAIFLLSATLGRQVIPASNSAAAVRSRRESIHLLRGVTMVLMALDHTPRLFRSYRHQSNRPGANHGCVVFCRWITHFCAPVFFHLTGTRAYLSRRKP
jgi:uncharacterized membrane protein